MKTIEHILEFIQLAILTLVSWYASLLFKEKEVIVAFIILMMIDTALGVAAAIKQKRSITSARFLSGISYKIVIFFCVATIGIIVKYYAGVDIIKPLVFLGVIAESISIKENVHILFNIDIFQALIDKIKGQMKYKDGIKDIIKDIKDIKNEANNFKRDSDSTGV